MKQEVFTGILTYDNTLESVIRQIIKNSYWIDVASYAKNDEGVYTYLIVAHKIQ